MSGGQPRWFTLSFFVLRAIQIQHPSPVMNLDSRTAGRQREFVNVRRLPPPISRATTLGTFPARLPKSEKGTKFQWNVFPECGQKVYRGGKSSDLRFHRPLRGPTVRRRFPRTHKRGTLCTPISPHNSCSNNNILFAHLLSGKLQSVNSRFLATKPNPSPVPLSVTLEGQRFLVPVPQNT